MLLKAAVMAEIVAMVGHVDNQRVVFQIEPPQGREHAADIAIEETDRGVIGGVDAPLLLFP